MIRLSVQPTYQTYNPVDNGAMQPQIFSQQQVQPTGFIVSKDRKTTGGCEDEMFVIERLPSGFFTSGRPLEQRLAISLRHTTNLRVERTSSLRYLILIVLTIPTLLGPFWYYNKFANSKGIVLIFETESTDFGSNNLGLSFGIKGSTGFFQGLTIEEVKPQLRQIEAKIRECNKNSE